MQRYLALLLCGLIWAVPTHAAEPLTPAQFGKLQAVLVPQASVEKWTEIPWQTDLWAARQQAAREGKPLLLWEMDGHPLGCV